jgi:hypothetical protein
MGRAILISQAIVGGMIVLGTALTAQATEPVAKSDAGIEGKSTSDIMGTWARSDQEARFQPPSSGPGPVRDDPSHPHHGHREGVPGLPDQEATPWVADVTNPILKPWVADTLRKNAARGLAGDTVNPPFVFCRPMGVPGSLVLLENMQLIRTPTEVTILYQRDQQQRHIHLDVPHSDHPESSYYGESVGHFEGETLVVDTIGMNDKTVIDLYSTPHSDSIHVIERYHAVNGGNTLQVDFTVDDTKSFNMPWSATVHYRKGRGFAEVVCAENNLDVNTGKLYPLPIAAKSDF